MPVEPSEHLAGEDGVHTALEEIRACHRESEEFFSDVFDQLGAMSDALSERQEYVEKTARGRRGEPDAGNGRIEQLLEEARQERAELRGAQQAIREQLTRFAATAAELAENRQQDQSTDELKQMRLLLEQMSDHLRDGGSTRGQPPQPKRHDHEDSAPTAADPALDSVMAQFEILQQDIARRRTGRRQTQAQEVE